jgi:hypothetical protein
MVILPTNVAPFANVPEAMKVEMLSASAVAGPAIDITANKPIPVKQCKIIFTSVPHIV